MFIQFKDLYGNLVLVCYQDIRHIHIERGGTNPTTLETARSVAHIETTGGTIKTTVQYAQELADKLTEVK